MIDKKTLKVGDVILFNETYNPCEIFLGTVIEIGNRLSPRIVYESYDKYNKRSRGILQYYNKVIYNFKKTDIETVQENYPEYFI